MANTFKEAVTFPPKPAEPRQESDREKIATIIQRGHIGHKTSDEIAGEVIAYVNLQFHIHRYNNAKPFLT